MTATLEFRKKSLVELLAETTNESIVSQIEALLKPSKDIWDELSEAQKSIIHLGARQLKEGKKVNYRDFMTNYIKKRA